MSTPLAPAAAPSADGAVDPVRPEERILTLDVLRGMALLGVAVANVWAWFSGAYFRSAEVRAGLRELSLDTVAYQLVAVLVSGKAMSIFSLLFGVGFAVQMARAEGRGKPIGPLYRRRMAVLLAMGLAHGVLLWYGDILSAYAVLGFALLLFRKRSDRALAVWAGVLLVAVPLLFGVLMAVAAASGSASSGAAAQRAADLAAFQGGDPGRIVGVNVRMFAQAYLGPAGLQIFPYVMGVFLLGLLAGRRGIVDRPSAHLAAFRRAMVWGFVTGIPANVGLAAARASWTAATGAAYPWLYVVISLWQVISVGTLSAAYVSAVVLLMEDARWKARLARFAPAGRMALTHYLGQSVAFSLIFYGYGGGLIGRVGSAAAVSLALLVFALQMAVSPWWLARFRFGPAEWAWRSLTYGRLQPMRIPRPAARPGLVG